ncbi:2,3-diaminopropionate biosynthesis protein SbnA [Amycolatopsis coloradensis]|uniref:2,3-diaminopropionate biosynthesis protein SbnA n=1 Tax=Amycolatopsis coloradensis TaxID=76021 RepID=A0A1R0KQV2_9PSEU|nr:2,3-diaminopropionate biosynthesis protein SbnA [Amycolatopsis coloradensis]OLZ50008.1 2,3-diaminopropionate biosynthesis protein SbnA [Amycolatopsis coloradensis]
MPIISAPHEFIEDDLYVDLGELVGHSLYLKCEGLNLAGSIKLKAAAEMVTAAEREGLLRPGSILVESSSGNLGIALSMIAASKGYQFLCVTDSRCNAVTKQLMEAYGSKVHTISEPLPDTGFLGARLAFVDSLCARDDRFVWLNQYRNPNNSLAHYQQTAPAILKQFPDVQVLFIGAGTTGTLMGCAQYFREHKPDTTLVGVDTVGSVTFGGPPAPRLIPGVGAGVLPPLYDSSFVDNVVMVPEPDTVRTCRRLARQGFLFGGSTGTVISGALKWLSANPLGPTEAAVAIAPDFGERYLDTVYRDSWVQETYGSESALDLTFEGVREHG